jgi:hypothetical protein
MTTQGDFFRDIGIDLARDAQDRRDSTWSVRAYAALLELARRQPLIHIDDFLLAFPERPDRPNANGHIWIKARREGVLVPSGENRKCMTDGGKHSHIYPVYRSMIFRREPAA